MKPLLHIISAGYRMKFCIRESRHPQQYHQLFNWYICQSFKYSIPTCMPQPLRTELASVSWLGERIIVSKDLDKESLRPPGSWHSSAIQGMGLSQSGLTHMGLKPRSSLFQVNTLTPATACSLAGPSLWGFPPLNL